MFSLKLHFGNNNNAHYNTWSLIILNQNLKETKTSWKSAPALPKKLPMYNSMTTLKTCLFFVRLTLKCRPVNNKIKIGKSLHQ